MITRLLSLILATSTSSASAVTQVAVTVDDLPKHGELPKGTTRLEVARKVLDALDKHGLHGVYGFLNGKRVDELPEGPEILREWVSRGQYLGNHTHSHPDLNKTAVDAFETDILRDEPALKTYSPRHGFKWFRYPFLDEGRTPDERAAVRSFLADNQYRIAEVSITFGDWNWQDPYARCLDQRDRASLELLKKSYLEAALAMLRYNRELSRALFGREIRFVLLVHLGAFTAEMLDALLTSYEKAGVEFVSLEAADQDEAYRADAALPGEWSGPFLDQLRIQRNLPRPKRPDKPAHSPLAELCKPH